MHVWIVLLSLLLPQPGDVATAEEGASNDEPLRYRGIEALLAKFDAQAAVTASDQKR